MPTNSIEFETLTTEPTWGDVEQFETTPKVNDKGDIKSKDEFWRVLGFMNRDLRLGNFNNMFDDFEWLEDRTSLTANILHLREGSFSELAPLCFSPVASSVELSQSRNGFFRKNSRTAHLFSEQTEKAESKGGFINRLFGKGKGVN